MEEKINLSNSIRRTFNLPDTDIKSYSGLTLAYIGDAIYELIVRTYIVEQGNAPVNKLHKKVVKLLEASAQAKLFHQIEDRLTVKEQAVYKRGRNAKSFTSAKMLIL